MTRYDWPVAPFRGDDPVMRAAHTGRVRPGSTPAADTTGTSAPPASRLAAAVAPRDEPAGTGNLWFPIGPSVTVNGQATGDPNVAGRIRDLQVEPVSGQRVYAASAAGGCWYSPDAGETWRPLDDFAASDRTRVGDVASALACGSVHVIWGGQADGSADEVWVGTGEPTLWNGRPGGRVWGLPGGKLRGIGLLTATGPAADGQWSVVTAQAPPGDENAPDSLRGHATYRITGDPGDPQQLVAGTTNGVYLRPTGADWGKVTSWNVTDSTHPLDVAMNRLTGPDRVRIWVASTSTLFMAEAAVSPGAPISPATLTFQPVLLPGIFGTPAGGSRLQLASSADGSRRQDPRRRPRPCRTAGGPPGQRCGRTSTVPWTPGCRARSASPWTCRTKPTARPSLSSPSC